MKSNWNMAALVAMGAVALAQPQAMAQTAPANTGVNQGTPTEQAPAAASLQQELLLAHDLYRLGVAEGDAMLVVAAARIFARIPVTDSARESATDAPAGTAPTGQVPTLDLALATARQMGEGNSALLAMVDQIRPVAARGRVGGIARDSSWVAVNHQRTYRESFYGGEYAQVSIAGDGSSLLNLSVYDENGNLLCLSRRAGDRQICGWNPRWTGPFRIVVTNVGGYAANYNLLTN